MLTTLVLFGFLVVTTITDIRWHKIYNGTTYPGMLTALLLSGVATWFKVDDLQGTADQIALWGAVPIADCLLGWFSCGALLLVCYVFFPGGVGGGDVKLMAMLGAFLGTMAGLEAMLWTFVLGACFALISLIWRFGFWTLVARCGQVLWHAVRLGGTLELSSQERQPLKTELYLSPSALLATLMVRFDLINRLW